MQNYNAFCDRSLWFLSGQSTRREPRDWRMSEREPWERECKLRKFDSA